MTAIKKFMFDLSFDEEVPEDVPEAEAAPEEQNIADEIIEEIEEVIVPTFSEEELAAAKLEAYETGMQDGSQKASETIERETLSVIRAISQHITELFAVQEQVNNRLMGDGIGIAASITRKMFPDLNERNGINEINRLIETTLLRLIEEPRVVIRINPELLESIGSRIDGLKAGAGYEGRIVLKEDDSIAHGDCRIEWGDGSAERNTAALWQAIDDIVNGHLNELTSGDSVTNSVEVTTELNAKSPTAPEVPEGNESESDEKNS